MSRLECIADICNLFIGYALIKASDLIDADPNSIFKDEDKDLALASRDNLVRWIVGNVLFALIGIESQTAVDVDMVVRVLFYDALGYKNQVRNKDGKRVPVITFVVYYGEKPWTGPTTLRECVEFLGGTEKALLPLFNDFKLNIIDFHTIPFEKIEAMTSDFRYIATLLYNAAHRDDPRPFPPVKDVGFIREFMRIFKQNNLGKKFTIDEISDEKLKQGGYGMNELVMSYVNAEINDRVAAILPVRVAEQVAAIVPERVNAAVANTREEDRLAFEQKMKQTARRLSLKGIPSDEIADALNVEQATVDAWLSEKQA